MEGQQRLDPETNEQILKGLGVDTPAQTAKKIFESAKQQSTPPVPREPRREDKPWSRLDLSKDPDDPANQPDVIEQEPVSKRMERGQGVMGTIQKP